MHQGQKVAGMISSLSDPKGIATTTASEYSKVSAFAGTTAARSLINEVAPVIKGFSSADEQKEYVKDISNSGAFDWPSPEDPSKATKLYDEWSGVFKEFGSMRDEPRKMNEQDVIKLFERFLKLEAPASHH